MKGHRTEPLGAERLAAYLEGEVTASDAALIADGLRQDALAQHHLEQLKQIREALAAPSDVDSIDLVSRVESCLARPAGTERGALGRARVGVWGWIGRGLFPLGAAAAVLVAALAHERSSVEASGLERTATEPSSTPTPAEFRSKAAAVGSSEARRWAGIQVWRLTAADLPVRVHEASASEPRAAGLRAADRLVFSYTNGGREPFTYLMIFGVDASGQVYWFYPSYERAGSNPASVGIDAGAVEMVLPNAIEHALQAGLLEMHGLFSRRPLHVDAVERWLERRRGGEARSVETDHTARGAAGGVDDISDGSDAFLQVLRLWVEP